MAHGIEQRARVGIEDLIVDGIRLLGEQRPPFLETGIVEDGVEPAETCDGALDQPCRISLSRHIGGDEQALAAQSAKLVGERFAEGLPPSGDHDRRRAFGGHAQRRRPTDAAGRAGDEADPSGEPSCG
jgi:hypothetical protein